jgi:SAM-dependent methyltransferase
MFDGEIGYRVLRRLRPPREGGEHVQTLAYGLPYAVTLRDLLGPEWESQIRGKTIIDFGCGNGRGSVEMARHGAGHVIGLDIRQDRLGMARELAASQGVADFCLFATHAEQQADYVISVDAFEHFDDPAGVMRSVHAMLRPGGAFVVSFGPTWFHPRGGHFFSIFPWSHLLFSERAQIRWRAEFKHDGATRFTEVEGGLNLMTIRRFEELAAKSGFDLQVLRLVPIHALRWLHGRLTREFTTSMVECVLVKPGVV